MKTQLFIGQSSLRGAVSKYADRFNLLELRAELGRLPRTVVLRRWTEEVPRSFVFSVLLSREVGRFGPNYDVELELGLSVADAVKAKWMVVQTDPTVGPSQRSRQRLQELFARLAGSGRSVAWEPHGVWQEDEAAVWTRQLGVNLVRDVSRADPFEDDIIYSRMPGLGTSSRLSAGALEHAASSLIHASAAYIVVCGDHAGKASQLLRGLVQDGLSADTRARHLLESPEVFGEYSSESAFDELDGELDDTRLSPNLVDDDEESAVDDSDDSDDGEQDIPLNIDDSDENLDSRLGRASAKKRQGVKRR
jgi:uncharacterized protein YecE (DUF72 family)